MMIRSDTATSEGGYTPSIESDTTMEPDCRGVTVRVVLLCLGLAVLFGIVIPLIDVKMSNTFLGATHLPPGAIGVLLILLLVVNPLLGMLSRRGRFSRNETLVVYISCLFSCLVPGHGSENLFVSNLVGPFYFATRENGWLDFLGPNLKPWFTPAISDGQSLLVGGNSVVQAWYTGAQVGGAFVPWGAWLVPLVAWGSLILASYVLMACLSVILRAQWAEREALPFPLLRLPLEMTEGANEKSLPHFFRSPGMWAGFGLVFCIQLIRGLHLYFPDVPNFPLELDIGPVFSEAPWNQIGWVPVQVFPVVLGIAYLLTAEISFSVWFFFWFIKFSLVAAYLLGFQPSVLPTIVGNGDKLFTSMQVIGALVSYVALLMWTAREHLGHVAKRAFGKARAHEGEGQEALSYPLAFWGFVGALVFCVGWCTLAGISVGVSLWMWAMYLIIAIGLSRAVAEGGVLFVQFSGNPLAALAHLFGAGAGTILPVSSIVPGSLVQGSLMTDMRGFLMPSFMQSFKLAKDRGIAAKPLLALIGAVTVIGLILGMLMNVRIGHHNGGLALEWWFAQGSPQQNAGLISTLSRGLAGQGQTGIANWLWMGFGALLTFGMMLARSRFMWFPLHPIGYLMCTSYAMQRLWFSFFLAWCCKGLITRFGGSDGYRNLRPIFLGLALGDIVAMLFWLLVDGWFGRTGHQLMPS